MSVPTFTKSGTKATTAAKLPKEVFEVEVKNHDLLKQAYVAYQANGRLNLSKTLKRGEVRGGGKKPWKQKGTGRARFGSSRVPIWRGGGITFGPTGDQNYTKAMPTNTKREAIRQALTVKADNIIVLETFECKDGKVAPTVKLLDKLGATRNVLLVVSNKDELVERATRNVPNLIVTHASYLNVFNIINADTIILTNESIDIISGWLSKPVKKTPAAEKVEAK
jgi:large subunit ribosomal protein L4